MFFNAVWDGATGGAESFFLVDVDAPPPPVSEPGTLLLLGLGLLGLGLRHGGEIAPLTAAIMGSTALRRAYDAAPCGGCVHVRPLLLR